MEAPEDGQNDIKDVSSEWNDYFKLNDEEVDKQWSWTSGLDTLDDRKTLKVEKKLAKSRTRFSVITQSDLQHVQRALHPEALVQATKTIGDDQGLVNNSTIETNIAFKAHCFRWSNLRQAAHEKKLVKQNSLSQATIDLHNEEQSIMQDILELLDIKTSTTYNTKERKGLVNKLNSAIKADLIAHENEQVETMQRMAGYWRYVNRRTYNAMVRTNMLWDWATGQKLPEIDESELGDTSEEDEESMSGITQATTPPTDPEEVNGWDTNFQGFQEKERIEGGDETLTMNTCGIVDADMRPLLDKQQTGISPDLISCIKPYASDALGRGTGEIDEEQPSQFPPDKAHEHIFPKKDSRILEKAIRAASPPKEEAPSTTPRYHTTKKTPKTPIKPITPTNANLMNTYGTLNSETPAPCEDPQLQHEKAHIHLNNSRKHPPLQSVKKEDFPNLLSNTTATTAADTEPHFLATNNQKPKVLNITAAAIPEKGKGWQGGKKGKVAASAGGKRLLAVSKAAGLMGVRSTIGDAEGMWTDVVRGGRGRR